MGLHDVDKTGIDRSAPTPNSVDTERVRKAHGSLSTTYQSNGDTSKTTRVRFANNMILFFDDQNRIIRVDGFIPTLAAYPVSITAIYGYDVFVDILGLPSPAL